MFHPAAPPGSACLPLGRRFHPINILKRWPDVPSIRILHRRLSAPTQAGAPLIEQGVGILHRSFYRIMGVLDFLLYNYHRYMVSARKTVV